MTSNEQPKLDLRYKFIFLVIGGGLGWGVIILSLMLTGRFALENDNRFAEFHVCRDITHYEPVPTILAGTKTLYVCGVIEGYGSRGAILELYLNNHLIDRDYYFDHHAGIFLNVFILTRNYKLVNIELRHLQESV